MLWSGRVLRIGRGPGCCEDALSQAEAVIRNDLVIGQCLWIWPLNGSAFRGWASAFKVPGPLLPWHLIL